ncbi:hypothetical protein GCM10010350_51840 [Streptomyces galilaeus]|nr:hypothetical protein GCM10010350_51840 [Streptomyces galilaeus]
MPEDQVPEPVLREPSPPCPVCTGSARGGREGAAEESGPWRDGRPKAAVIAATTVIRPGARSPRTRRVDVLADEGGVRVTPGSQGGAVLPSRIRFSICRRYGSARSLGPCVC